MMQHQYPFCVLYFTMDTELLDVNVHPTKMELRFSNNEEVYRKLYQTIRDVLTHKEFIPAVPVEEKKEEKRPAITGSLPEPFETKRLHIPPQTQVLPQGQNVTPEPVRTPENLDVFRQLLVREESSYHTDSASAGSASTEDGSRMQEMPREAESIPAADTGFFTPDAARRHRIIGEVFDTYWLIEYEDKLFIIDQHAAHEKVLYERTMARVRTQNFASQTLSPPLILTLSAEEQEMLTRYGEQIRLFGYEVEPFGGKEFAITAIPADFEAVDMKGMFLDMLDDFTNISGREAPELILEKVASMSCKAAIKGGDSISRAEAEQLIDELLSLENPYHCPHGRPTIISMSKYEIEKKFKRIV